jgi:glycosyltransferase involved in cell wall biosynthesis
VPDVCVVIPTHDRRRLLQRTLRSALAQRSVVLEVVVVDDGSSDGTAQFVEDLDDPRVCLVRHDVARGVATARNAGVVASTARWIAFLDDDDLWAPDKLARQLAAAEAAGTGWVYAGAVEIDVHDRLVGGEPPPRPERLLAELTRQNLMPAGSSNVVILADMFRACGGFDAELRHLADWDLWLRLARREEPSYVPEPLVAYRIHAGQATMDTAGMMAEAEVLRERHGADPASIRRWLAWSHLRRGNRRAAIGAYARAVAVGDVSSVARAAVAALHPHPTAARRRPPSDAVAAWIVTARPWLDAASEG